MKTSKNFLNCKKKFLHFFPKGFQDEKYYSWERTYKWETHKQWKLLLNRTIFEDLLKKGNFEEICHKATKIEAKTHLLFSFEKMAIRDALKTREAQRLFAEALYQFIYQQDAIERKFEKWSGVVASLPRKQTRVLTWPILTIFGFIAEPKKYIYFKPTVTRKAALLYGFDLFYESPPSLKTYISFLEFIKLLRRDLKELQPKDLIDIQSFIWVLGSSEYD